MFSLKSVKTGSEEIFGSYIEIIKERQLLDRDLWKKCIDVFASGIDNSDAGWRGEYWGKMMRGACLIYRVSPSDELLSVLTDAVEGLFTKQEADGRISSYRRDSEFCGWDMWSRKYVMTGLQHFYDICPDDELKERIMTVLTAHADYIVEHIGEGKISVLDTSSFWGGVNSASILEPFVRLYKDTKNEKYLDFARYIISTGGCSDGSLIECAMRGIPPYIYPEQKAYETMSFFEGLLAYYELTGEEKYLEAVKNFTYAMLDTDVTVIGSCGCTHELFDNSAMRQTEHIDNIMQETCVTVTLIRFLSRLYGITGDKRLADTVRLASLNALSGALNINGYEQLSRERNEMRQGMVFDSYSPLCNSRRAMGIGGFKTFADGSNFGCCACIASAGFALYPTDAVTVCEDGIRVNYIVNGVYTFSSDDGSEITLTVSDESIAVNSGYRGSFSVAVTCGDDFIAVNASCKKSCTVKDGFTVFSGEWNGFSEIKLSVTKHFVEKKLNGKSSFNYGGHVLAADEAKGYTYKPSERVEFVRDDNGDIVYELCSPEAGEQIRIRAQTTAGGLILTDYASAGQDGKSIINVWF